MKLSISNIAWGEELDYQVYEKIEKYDYLGVEIAPTRIFSNRPYEDLISAKAWCENLMKEHNLMVSSMQSILYGRRERVFGSKRERRTLLDYIKNALDFANVISCRNLVFGCPRNRIMTKTSNIEDAILFFRELGEYALKLDTVLAMEANPPIYNTNFLNTSLETMEFIEKVGSEGFLLNLDVGTMIENDEDVSIFLGKEKLINHVHISEPRLKKIKKRDLHIELASMLRSVGYDGFVSVEVGQQRDINSLSEMMEYVKEVFG